jgi:hypothetical protein
MIKEFKLKEKPNVQAVTLEKSMSSIAEVLAFAYGESYIYSTEILPDDQGLLLMTLGGPEKMLYGDTLVKDSEGNLSVQWTPVFNSLYEEVTNG